VNKYSRLSEKDRISIEKGINAGYSIRKIAATIDRPPKTVSQEIARNGGWYDYRAVWAHKERNKSNRFEYSKIDKNPELASFIREKLKKKWSPEVIAGRLKKEKRGPIVSMEAIYQWIYKQKDDLYLELARKKKRRGLRPQRSKTKIPNRTSIHDRPVHINDRSEEGHHEVDLVFQQGSHSQNILSIVERKTRFVSLRKNESKHTRVIMKSIQEVRKSSIKPVKSLTFDNGSEFTGHSQLGIDTYFCDPASPWQKGAIENINAILRRYIDYRIDPKLITQEILDKIAYAINNKPRKILGFATPYEAAGLLPKGQSRMKLAAPAIEAEVYNEKLEGVTLYS